MIKFEIRIPGNMRFTEYLGVFCEKFNQVLKNTSNDNFKGIFHFYGNTGTKECFAEARGVIISEEEYDNLLEIKHTVAKLKETFDNHYDNKKGFDPGFLARSVKNEEE